MNWMVYLLDESSSLECALVTTPFRPKIQRCLIWRAFASQRSSGGDITGVTVRFLMASAACPLVNFAIHLNYRDARGLRD
jgi:hypothetical protein